MVEGKANLYTKYTLAQLGVEMSPGSVNTSERVKAASAGDIVCLVDDYVQLGHVSDGATFKVCAELTFARYGRNRCRKHGHQARCGLVLNVAQSLEAHTGIIQANSRQVERQAYVNRLRTGRAPEGVPS